MCACGYKIGVLEILLGLRSIVSSLDERMPVEIVVSGFPGANSSSCRCPFKRKRKGAPAPIDAKTIQHVFKLGAQSKSIRESFLASEGINKWKFIRRSLQHILRIVKVDEWTLKFREYVERN